MKKFFIVFFLLLLVPSLSLAADFVPSRLQLTMPGSVNYAFDGSTLEIPVTVSGTPARCWFFVFTRGKGEEIGEVRNGYLGWHYVNKIDTCMYVSTNFDFDIGQNTITWAGKDDDGGTVPAGDYTYYVFAYDHLNAPDVNMAAPQHVTFRGEQSFNSVLVKELDESGMPVSNPVLWDHRVDEMRKWVLGSDPNDTTLVETCDLQIPDDWQYQLGSPMGPMFDDHSQILFSETNKDALLMHLRKGTWVPNDLLVREEGWGFENSGCQKATMGPIDDGNYIYMGKGDMRSPDPCQDVFIVDRESGELMVTLQNDAWIKPDEYQRGLDLGVAPYLQGGPRWWSSRDGSSLVTEGCYYAQVAFGDPLRYLESFDYPDYMRAYNTNGDYVCDNTFQPDHATPWLSFLDEAPFQKGCYFDANFFTVIPHSGAGSVSFSLMAPDYTGIGYQVFAGEAGTRERNMCIVDRDTAYDGWYVRAQEVRFLGFVGHDSVQGLLTSAVVVADDAPTAFAVEQNSPNPANPTTTISFTLPEADNVTVDVFNVAGQKIDTLVNDFMDSGRHSVVWDGSRFSSGVYFYTVTSGDYTKTMKMTLLK